MTNSLHSNDQDYAMIEFNELLIIDKMRKNGDFNSFYRALEIAIKSRNSISGFAKKIGMSRTHLYSLFKNEKEPKFSTIVKIFHELGYELEIA